MHVSLEKSMNILLLLIFPFTIFYFVISFFTSFCFAFSFTSKNFLKYL